ncbi:hypothetical protein MPDQ_007205 [Monascus purpureus]|uniref:Uncharacterized protein n=1 Tax=Monascus purpureus TaxID=5098 RepID=A0A507QUL1_MONPU|nr:hypothetical protein MPDQ_007205 [Monascus purpureus]
MPTRSQRLLATSLVFESSSPPRTTAQWKRVLSGVKLLYIQRQYKQCAACCAEILQTAREPTFLYFYSAISYEILGRSAHNYSSNKIPFLQQALDYFMTCNEVLSFALPVSETVQAASHDESPPSMGDVSSLSGSSGTPSSVGSLVHSITRIIEKSIDSPGEDPFVSDREEVPTTPTPASFQVAMYSDDDKENVAPGLMPPPLRIRKSSGDLALAAAGCRVDNDIVKVKPTKSGIPPRGQQRTRRPPPLPLQIIPARERRKKKALAMENREEEHCTPSSCSSSKTVIVHRDKCMPTSVTPICPPTSRRYSNSICALLSQVKSNISAIYSLIDDVTEAQRIRRACKIRRSASFWSFSPAKDDSRTQQGRNGTSSRSGSDAMGIENKEQRIARLRAEGWKTVGLKSGRRGWKGVEYYRAYCESVLNELYLDA